MNQMTEFYTNQLKPLVGGTVVAIASAPPDEEGTEFFGLIIKTKEGKRLKLFLLSDDEGNGPGSFELSE